MGALVDGFEVARQRRNEEIAEKQRKDGLIDHELHELAHVFDQDASFLKDNGVAYDVANRVMRVTLRRAPMVSVHYGADSQEYVLTVMQDGSHTTLKTTEECAKAIGELLFKALAPKGA
jgi:hypothetical protein